MDDLTIEMNMLDDETMDQVAGGWVQSFTTFGALATTYKVAYETANFFGAGTFGTWLGGEVYDIYNYN